MKSANIPQSVDYDLAVNALHAATAFYTVDPAVADLLDRLNWPACGGRLLDPGAGDGAFITAAIARLNLLPNDIEGLCQRAEAWEIHPVAVTSARHRLAVHLTDRGWSANTAAAAAERVVIHGDFLAGPILDSQFTIIAGNPPYLRFANLPQIFKATYSTLPAHARGDLLHAFVDRAARMVVAGGQVGLITSDRWLFNSQAAALRQHLGCRLSIIHLHRLDSATTFYRAKDRRRGTPPRVHPVQVIMAANDGEAHTFDPRGIISSRPDSGLTLGDVATIHCAPYLGPDGIFCLTREKADVTGIHERDLVPIADIPRDTDDAPRTSLYAIRTTRDQKPSAAILHHLDATRHLMPARGIKAQGSCEWAPPEPWAHRLPLPHPALIMPRIINRVRLLPLPPGHMPRNHNLVIEIQPEHQTAVQRYLSSESAWRVLFERAPRLENDYIQVSAPLLRSLPVVLD